MPSPSQAPILASHDSQLERSHPQSIDSRPVSISDTLLNPSCSFAVHLIVMSYSVRLPFPFLVKATKTHLHRAHCLLPLLPLLFEHHPRTRNEKVYSPRPSPPLLPP